MKCEKCGKEVNKLYAKGMCRKCYDKSREESKAGQYVYIALCEDGGLYVGSTANIYRRMINHTNESNVPSKPLGAVYENYPNLTKLQRLQLERYLINEIEPEHNTRIPTIEVTPYDIRALGRELLDKLMNGKLSVAF